MRLLTKIFVHHTGNNCMVDSIPGGTPKEDITVALIDSWHNSRFKKHDPKAKTQYHYVILDSGVVINTRPVSKIGWCVRGHNEDSVSICVVGNFEFEEPSLQQLVSLKQLLLTLCKEHKLQSWDICGHRDKGQTLCPGRNLYNKLPEIRPWITKQMIKRPLENGSGLSRITLIHRPKNIFERLWDIIKWIILKKNK